MESSYREFSIADAVLLIRRHALVIAVCLVLGALGGVAVAYMQSPVYRATVLVAISREEEGPSVSGTLQGQLGGLAQLAGLGGGGGDRAELISFLESKQLAVGFIARNELARKIFPERWDADAKTWRLKGNQGAPTEFASAERFNGNVKSVIEDKVSGLISLSIDWPDRVEVAKLANEFIAYANQMRRQMVISETSGSLDHLAKEAESTSLVAVRDGIYRLMEAQISRRMLATVRPDYAFRVVDPAMQPDVGHTVRPRRMLIVLLAASVGATLGLIAAFFLGMRGASRKDA